MEVKEHYDNHLGKYYTWMSGDFEGLKQKMLTFFRQNNIGPKEPGQSIAIDLGAGAGTQSLPLAALGFSVKAIDFSSLLLAELKENIQNEDIEVIESDIMNFEAYSHFKPELIICMGDTLTHLPDIGSIEKLVGECNRLLIPCGKLILQFRDLHFELQGSDRFIPVKLTDDRIFTCYLEYMSDHVNVHDIVYEKEEGQWNQKISQYRKLKLSATEVEEILQAQGFIVSKLPPERGMQTLIAEKK